MGKPYHETLLGDNETVALVAHPHRVVFIRSVGKTWLLMLLGVAVAIASWSYRDSLPEETRVPLVLFGVALLAFGLVIAFYRYLVWSATQYVITSRRVILIRGIYAKEAFDSSLDFINDLHLRQSFWGRLLGFGHIDVLTASEDTNEGQENYQYVANPAAFLRALEEKRERRRQSAMMRRVIQHPPEEAT